MNFLAGVDQERIRVSELKKYNILDSSPESEYEQIALVASSISQAPISLISFVDENRQWLKSCIGVSNLSEMDRMHSFCTHAIQNPTDIMIVEDARKDSRFQNNPYVMGEPNLVFYAGMPLVNKQRFALGAICVLDTKPRTLTEKQAKALKLFSIQVMHMLELRRISYEHEMLQAKIEAGNHESSKMIKAMTGNIKLSLRHVLADNPLQPGWYQEENCSEDASHEEVGKQMREKIKSLIEKMLSYYTIDNS